MSKKFNIREWVLSVKYWSLLFIPHISICFIFLIYTLVGASIIQEIESDDPRTTSSPTLETTPVPVVSLKNFDRERERLLSKITDKRQTGDAQQYTKYVNKHIREYEEEIKKTYQSIITTPSTVVQNTPLNEESPRWTFAGSLYFIGTTLTTIGSNDFTPTTKIGKLFLMIYAAIGIPLTLVFLSDLSLLITRLIKYLSLLLLRAYSTKYFLQMRQWILFRFIEKQLDILIPLPTDEDDLFSQKSNQLLASSFDNEFNENDQPIHRLSLKQRRLSKNLHLKHIKNIYNILIDTLKDINDDTNLTMPQLIITLFIYILMGACLFTSNSFFDSIYICFTSIFTINLRNYYRNATIRHENNMKLIFILAIYLLFGLAIVSLCVKAVQIRIQITLENIGKKLLLDLIEFLRQMGFHELSTDDILATTNHNSQPISGLTSESILSRQQRSSRTIPYAFEQISTSVIRPVGIAEPVPRPSTGLIIRAFKNSESDTNTDKSVQVNTIIRSCGRCAGSSPSPSTSLLSVRRHSAMSASSLSPGETSSGCEDEDTISPAMPPPNLDRLRQRRATLVAKTILNQMATQPPILAVDEPMPSLTLLTAQRHRPMDASSSVLPKYSTTKLANIPSATSRKRDFSQEEFSEISKQISSLLTPSDDEN
ncbi:unnamed protein product [Rotaria sp. Silwood2]|nr:unnamed protein product [Rotaria sp. Silwood2]CAF2529635.1 unnamed protein product [Rotaria sp. Silwood2]CAF2763891.1 unnamed protein product [Rotaria sp. Silwood2]CAF2940944.1 unnamed protein product [Rotaria sp. Silwood2]CAF3994466.1 unnamed protein product [Rotaria sp. Silwood2]